MRGPRHSVTESPPSDPFTVGKRLDPTQCVCVCLDTVCVYVYRYRICVFVDTVCVFTDTEYVCDPT